MTEIHHRVAQSSTECYLSDLKKYKEEGSRLNTTWLGDEATANCHIAERKPRVISHEQQMRFDK